MSDQTDWDNARQSLEGLLRFVEQNRPPAQRRPQSTPEDISSEDDLANGYTIAMYFPPTTPWGPMADVFSKVADVWADHGQGEGWQAELAGAAGDIAGLAPEQPEPERSGGYERPHP